MKIISYARFKWITLKGVAYFQPEPKLSILFDQLQEKKESRESRSGQELLVKVTVELEYAKKTFKQLRTVWKLVEIIFECQDGRPPTEEEKYDMYLDLLQEFADKIPSKVNPSRVRPIHISEADTMQAARFIQGLFGWLAELIDMPAYLQADVRDLFWEYEVYRGEMDNDPLDYQEDGTPLKREKWWLYHRVSDASGEGGLLQCAHIVSRGSDAEDIEEPWNWLSLKPEEHDYQHKHGWDAFLREWPHLRGRVSRARLLAGKLSLESKGATPWIKNRSNLLLTQSSSDAEQLLATQSLPVS